MERRCDKMYTCWITTIGGLESVTNYFHYVGSGHVVCMIRMYGNLWRYRNEGVEAFNNIVSLRHNKFNQQGGARKTCKGMPKQLCPEFMCKCVLCSNMIITIITYTCFTIVKS
jgi:hypothetical protein